MMMMHIQTHYIEQAMPYTGDALTNHWIYKNFGILGNAVAAFCGPCDVSIASMVDLEDVLNDDEIYSKEMLHFIVEIFGVGLMEGVLVQRLFSSILQHKLNDLLDGHLIERRGDDLFFQRTKKLSVSICTISPTSVLIHAGLNVESLGTPVETAGLMSDLGLERPQVQALAEQAMRALADEWKDMGLACCKVRAVR